MTNEQVEREIMKDLQEVVYKVADEVNYRLSQKLRTYVYDYGNNQRKYYVGGTAKPTGQLYDSITTELRTLTPKLVEYVVFSDPYKMYYDPENNVHGNRRQDRRAELLTYLNENSHFDYGRGNEWWYKHDPFLDYLESELDRDIWKLFEKEMRKIGMPLV